MKKEILNIPQIFSASNFLINANAGNVMQYYELIERENSEMGLSLVTKFSTVETTAPKNRKQLAIKRLCNDITNQVNINGDVDFSIQIIVFKSLRSESFTIDKQGEHNRTEDDTLIDINEMTDIDAEKQILIVLPFTSKELSIKLINELTETANIVFNPISNWQSQIPILKDMAEQDILIKKLDVCLEFNLITGPNFKFLVTLDQKLMDLTDETIRASTLNHVVDQIAKNLILTCI